MSICYCSDYVFHDSHRFAYTYVRFCELIVDSAANMTRFIFKQFNMFDPVYCRVRRNSSWFNIRIESLYPHTLIPLIEITRLCRQTLSHTISISVDILSFELLNIKWCFQPFDIDVTTNGCNHIIIIYMNSYLKCDRLLLFEINATVHMADEKKFVF